MNETISLGVGGDINLIKSRIISNPDCIFPVSIIKEKPEDKITYFNFEYKEDISTLDKYLNVLSEYIIDRYETRTMRKILDENFSQLSEKAKRDILKNVNFFEDDKEVGFDARKRCILLALYDCLKESTKVYLDGFVAFRLRDYETLLYKLAEKLTDDYSAKKEYEEFIELLTYFVEVQSPRPELLNVIVEKSGEYKIADSEGEDITAKCMEEFVGETAIMTEADYDDILISVLITAAPEKVVIHKAENIRNRDLFLTIRKVFKRIEYCIGCDLCIH